MRFLNRVSRFVPVAEEVGDARKATGSPSYKGLVKSGFVGTAGWESFGDCLGVVRRRKEKHLIEAAPFDHLDHM